MTQFCEASVLVLCHRVLQVFVCLFFFFFFIAPVMKIVKTRMRNKMEDEFLSDNLVVYIEKEITENFTTDSILDDFRSLKELRL